MCLGGASHGTLCCWGYLWVLFVRGWVRNQYLVMVHQIHLAKLRACEIIFELKAELKKEKHQPTVLFSCFILQTLALSYMSGTISRFVFGSSAPQYTQTALFDNNVLHPVIFYCFNHKPICIFYSYYDTKAVFLAMGITAVVCIAVTIFCFQTKVDGDVNCVSL